MDDPARKMTREHLADDGPVEALIGEVNNRGGNLSVFADGDWIVVIGYSLIPDDIVALLRLYKPQVIEYLGRRLI